MRRPPVLGIVKGSLHSVLGCWRPWYGDSSSNVLIDATSHGVIDSVDTNLTASSEDSGKRSFGVTGGSTVMPTFNSLFDSMLCLGCSYGKIIFFKTFDLEVSADDFSGPNDTHCFD